jgi:hypothetical protein
MIMARTYDQMIFRKSLETIKPNDPNRIDEIGDVTYPPPPHTHTHEEENFISNNNYIHYEQ